MGELFDMTKINAVRDRLMGDCESISAAESVTAGMLQLALASAEFASRYFQGGITAYNLGQKARHLMVNPIQALSCNCVSGEVAAEMALNACRIFSSEWGIGITGYASPVPESGHEVFCFFAVAHKGRIAIGKKVAGEGGTPLEVQQFYVGEVVKALHGHLCR